MLPAIQWLLLSVLGVWRIDDLILDDLPPPNPADASRIRLPSGLGAMEKNDDLSTATFGTLNINGGCAAAGLGSTARASR